MEWIGIVIFVVAVGGFIWYRIDKKRQETHTGSNGSGNPPGRDDDDDNLHQDEVS